MLKVLSFDPGITTGHTIGIIDDGTLKIQSFQDKWSVSEIWYYIEKQVPDIIVYEDFNYRNRARAGLELFPVQVIGVINLYAQMEFGTTAYAQVPGTGFDYYNDRKLKEDELYKPGHPHAMDALRHLLYWWTFGPGYKFNKNGYVAG